MKRARLSLDIDKPTKGLVQALAVETNHTMTDVIRISAKLMKLVNENAKTGGKIILCASDGRETELKILY